MNIHFHLHYKTVFGEQIGVEYFTKNDNSPLVHTLQTHDGEHWTGTLSSTKATEIHYRYIVIKNGQTTLTEWGKYRNLAFLLDRDVIADDKWRPRANENNAFLSTAFTKSIYRRVPGKMVRNSKTINVKNQITFKLNSAKIESGYCFGVIGNIKELGAWKVPVILGDEDFPQWSASIPYGEDYIHIEYKYVIIDPSDLSIKVWEEGDNRICHFVVSSDPSHSIVVTDDHFRHHDIQWKGAGVAIPVFSLRSEKGMGIGEFTDLRLLADWALDTGMKLIQVLPVNDTIANKSWVDSYPYAAISVFALHPLYINIQSIALFKSKTVQKEFEQQLNILNALESVDFESVLTYKFKFLRILFEQEYSAFKNDKDVAAFIDNNASWLPQYAAFCHLRDKSKTCNFNQWPQYAIYSDNVLTTLCDTTYEDIREIEFYYFIQYHADKQLYAAKEYARTLGVVLKGDLPIGIYRHSCDAWVAPSLYNMDEQAGAPPDDYAILGQNWGFPTYNWSVMAKDGFAWWRHRMKQLNRYFDALRIDHILGFFRIWQIPTDQVEGTMGSFNPRLPVSKDELNNYGISGDLSRFTMPYITQDILSQLFGNDLEEVFEVFFSNKNGKIVFKSSFDNQQKISFFTTQNTKYTKYEKALLRLATEVLLLVEPNTDGHYFNPRITLSSTYSYSQLDNYSKAKFNNLYNDYYFLRHDQYWKEQALWKLPAILDASDMLICGEDLGMIPAAVPSVMRDMNIISLEIQRMPKGDSKFGMVRSYPYFSVCSPSCHDMSTIRGWWEADHDNAKDFFYQYLHGIGLTPMNCTLDIVQAIVADHLSSPSMMAIFPIQDLVGMDQTLRKGDSLAEQINEPSNPKHYWKFRFHLTMESLLKSKDFNQQVKNMVVSSGR